MYIKFNWKKAHVLNNYNLELIKSIEGLKERREKISLEIKKDEEKKNQLEDYIEKLRLDLKNVESTH